MAEPAGGHCQPAQAYGWPLLHHPHSVGAHEGRVCPLVPSLFSYLCLLPLYLCLTSSLCSILHLLHNLISFQSKPGLSPAPSGLFILLKRSSVLWRSQLSCLSIRDFFDLDTHHVCLLFSSAEFGCFFWGFFNKSCYNDGKQTKEIVTKLNLLYEDPK